MGAVKTARTKKDRIGHGISVLPSGFTLVETEKMLKNDVRNLKRHGMYNEYVHQLELRKQLRLYGK